MKVQTLSYLYPMYGSVSFGSLHYVLKSFCDENYPDNDIEWCDPIYTWESPEQCVDLILSRNIDILLAPMYVWTELRNTDVCIELKRKNNYIKIIGGGPQISGKNIEYNFESYPFFDAVVYGDGEEAFYQLHERLKQTNELTGGLNCATPNDNGFYKRFRYEDYKPYLVFTGETNIKQFYKDIEDIPVNGRRLLINWETDRGCPFGCSFCDWSAGLHHKVTQKNLDIIVEELNNFGEVKDKVKILLNNANFGIMKHDGEILNKFIERKINFEPGNWSKIKKDVTYSLFEKYIRYDKQFEDDSNYKSFSLQSIYSDTLKAIDRPDIPWEKHREYIKRLARISGEDPISIEIISDLPYMNTVRHVTQLIEFSKLGAKRINYFQFSLLPNAPAYSKEWQDQWGYKEIKVYNVNFNVESLDEEHTRNMTTDYLSYLCLDTLQVKIFNTLLYEYYNARDGDISKLAKHLDTLYALSLKIERQLNQYKERTGIFVWGVYLSHQKRWVNFQVALIELMQFFKNSEKQKQLSWKNKNEILELLNPKNLAA